MTNGPKRREWLSNGASPVALARLLVVEAAPPVPDAVVLLSALPFPVLLLDAVNRLRFVNQAAEEMLGASAAHLDGHRLDEIVAADSPLFLLAAQVRATGATVSDHDMLLEGPRLRATPVAIQGTELSDAPGFVLLTAQDASAARALDRQMTVRSAARSVTGMAAMLAHEVKNPLSGIRGAAQLLEASVAESDRELTVLIRDEADRIRDLVDRMEAFGDRPSERGPINIHRLLEHVRRLAASGFAAHIHFTEEYDPSLPAVFGSRDQLVQVLLNLVKNAAEALVEAGHDDPEIVLSTAFQHGIWRAAPPSALGSPGGMRRHLPLVVSVRDNGPGIAPDVRGNLFDPFVTTKTAGTGLGLALVAKIVSDHGGMVEVDSRPGRTEFRLHLPMLADEPETD